MRWRLVPVAVAVAAIDAFGAKDLPEFDHLTTAPAEVFESGASSVALRRFALQTVERCRVCWSVRTVRALEQAAETEPTLAEGMRKAATRIRTSLE